MASKFVLEKLDVSILLFLRFAIAAAILLLILKTQELPKIEKKDYPIIFFIGFCGYFVSNGFLLLGIRFSSASVSSIINSMSPIFIALFARLLLKEPLTLRSIIAILFSVAGAVVIVGASVEMKQTWGILFSVSSMLIWSIVLIAIRKISQKYPPLMITAYGMTISAVCSLPEAVWSAVHSPVAFNGPLLLNVLYIGVVCTAVSHLVWNKCLSKMEAGRCAMFYPVQPMVSAILGCFLLGEKLNVQFVVGSILIISSLLSSILPLKRKKLEEIS